KLDSANADAFYNRSYVKFLLRFTREGILKDLDKAIEIDSANAKFYSRRSYLIANTYDLEIGQVNYSDAINDDSKAITLEPENPELYKSRGGLYFESGQILSATEDFNKAISIDPENPEYYNERGLVKLKIEDF